MTRDDVKALADSLATVRASAELLGRSRVRERAERAGLSTFADEPLSIFRDELPPAIGTPEAAVDYFMTLVPKLGIDPERFAGEQRRRAFTLAASANEVLTGKVRDRIAEGLRHNRSVADVTAEIQATLDEAGVGHRNPQYSEMVYRTNAMDSFQAGVYEEGRHPDVRDLFPTWEYLGIIDHRTGEDHRPKIGRYYPSDATFADVRGNRPFNCLPPGQFVSGRFDGGLKARYAGEVVEIHTAGGCQLTVTPNHPVLTPRGFVPAHRLTKADQVIAYGTGDDVVVVDVHEEDPPSLIEEVFEALAVLIGGPREAPVSPLDLHGDAARTQCNVQVVGADRVLLLDHVTATAEAFGDQVLSVRPVGLQPVPRLRPLRLDLRGVGHPASGRVGGGHLGRPLFPRQPVPLDPFGLGPAANLDARRDESAVESGAADPQFVRELLRRFPGTVAADEVLHVERRNFDGHVYDLSSEVGYYVADSNSIVKGILVSNCRCSLRWVDQYEWDDLAASGRKVETKW